jgi:hypothetical protein
MEKFKDLDNETKEKIKRLGEFVDEFLEKTFSIQELYERDLYHSIIKIIYKYLFNGEDTANSMNTLFNYIRRAYWEKRFNNILDENNEGYTPELYLKYHISSILEIHKILKKGIWDKLKERIFELQENRHSIDKYFEDMKAKTGDINLIHHSDLELKIDEISDSLREIMFRINLNDRKIYSFPTILDSIRAFQNLLEGIPIDCFKKCEGCSRCFIITNDHKRKFCNDKKCGPKYHQRKEREKDRKKFNEDHNKYYHEIKNGVRVKKSRKKT